MVMEYKNARKHPGVVSESSNNYAADHPSGVHHCQAKLFVCVFITRLDTLQPAKAQTSIFYSIKKNG